MANKFGPLGIRLATGIVYVGILLGSLFSGSLALMLAVFGFFVMWGLYEYQTITRTNRYGLVMVIIHSLMGGYLFVTVSLYLGGIASMHDIRVMMSFYAFYILFYVLGEMFRKRENPIEEVSKALLGHIYIALPFALMIAMYEQANPHYLFLLPIFILVWLNDTGAYLVGSAIGKHKLIERISPNKTIEGAIGGIVVTMIGGAVFFYLGNEHLSLIHWLVFGFLVSVFATLGDLFESYLKREYGVKDSGWIFPGHGGVLDRVDSILIVSAVAYFYYIVI